MRRGSFPTICASSERSAEGTQGSSHENSSGQAWPIGSCAIGLDVARYDECMGSGKYAGRIQASQEEGSRAGVSSTPTLLVGDRLYRGRIDSDAIRRLVDSLTPATP